MERTNTNFLQLIFDKYDISYDTKINEEITAFDFTIDYASLSFREQTIVLTEVAVAYSLNKDREEILKKLFEAHQLIKKINLLKGEKNE